MSESTQQMILWLIPGAPLAAAIVTALLGPKLLREKSHWPCWLAIGVSAICSLVLLTQLVPQGFGSHPGAPVIATGYDWIDIGGMSIHVDLQADAMTAIMLTMVTCVSLLVSVFGSGYMHGDGGYARFFAEVSLFVFSMCMLVLASQLSADVRVLGGRRALQLSLDRLLVPQTERGGRRQEGVRRQSDRRLRLHPGRAADLEDVRVAQFCGCIGAA